METILSFSLALIFSGWVLRLKTEIDTLEQLVRLAMPNSPHKTDHGNAESFQSGPVQDSPVKPIPAPDAANPDGGKAPRKGGVRVWTIS